MPVISKIQGKHHAIPSTLGRVHPLFSGMYYDCETVV